MARRESAPEKPRARAAPRERETGRAGALLEGKLRELLEELRPVLEELADDPAE